MYYFSRESIFCGRPPYKIPRFARFFYYNHTIWQFFAGLIFADFQKIAKSAKNRPPRKKVVLQYIIVYDQNCDIWHLELFFPFYNSPLITCHKWTFSKTLFFFIFSSLQVDRYDLYSPYRRITKDKGGKITQKAPRALKRVKMDMYFSLKSNCEIGCDKRCIMSENK